MSRKYKLCAACLLSIMLLASIGRAAEPVKVFILAGQSNMEGKAKLSLLEYQATHPETKKLFAHYRDGDGWSTRDDVWIKFLNRKGPLTAGYGSPQCIGPELEFGHVVGDHYDQQVLIIKTAWGGKSLFRDFRPPSAGEPPAEELERLLANQRKRRPQATMAEVKQSFGAYYRQMIEEVNDTLSHLQAHFPGYQGQGYEIAGFVWFQGWNDMINSDYTAEYSENMAHFIRDVRRDLRTPQMPFVIGQLGVGGLEDPRPNPQRDAFKEAQAAAGQRPEFQGNVTVVKTDVFWDMTADAVFRKGWREHLEEWQKVGSDRPYHYLGSAKTYCRIGAAFAKAVIALDEAQS